MNILRNFVALIKGMPDWHEKYNQDMSYLYDEVNGAKSDGIINTYTHSKTGTSHTLTGAGAIMRFTARAPWIAGDTVTVNGTRLNPLNLEGKPLPAGAFVAGMQVVAIQDGQNLQFLTQSYADQFANINSQMENKANKIISTVGLSAEENAGVFNQELFNESSGKDLPNGWIRIDKYDNGLIQLIFWLNNLKVRTYSDDNADLMTIPYGFQSDQQFVFNIGQNYLWSDANNGNIQINSCESGWIRGTTLYHTNQ